MKKVKVFTMLLAGLYVAMSTQCFAADAAPPASSISYEETLFDSSYVHTLNIEVDEGAWQQMSEHATEESYIPCTVTIDGEELSEVATRPKGNSSLAATQSSGSDRFSFKIEFDHYHAGTTYHGLDKLAQFYTKGNITIRQSAYSLGKTNKAHRTSAA